MGCCDLENGGWPPDPRWASLSSPLPPRQTLSQHFSLSQGRVRQSMRVPVRIVIAISPLLLPSVSVRHPRTSSFLLFYPSFLPRLMFSDPFQQFVSLWNIEREHSQKQGSQLPSSVLPDCEISLPLDAMNSETITDKLTSWCVLNCSQAEQ